MRDKATSTLLVGFLGLSLALIPQAAFAAGEINVEAQTKRLQRDLRLTPAQAMKVRSLLEAEKEVSREKQEETERQIAALLTGGQQQKLNKMIARREKRLQKQQARLQRRSLP